VAQSDSVILLVEFDLTPRTDSFYLMPTTPEKLDQEIKSIDVAAHAAHFAMMQEE
jgi:hypothetical protein